ncbi:MBL fold metallo-hydrolase [Melioribacteraceae bacterium 4301-Me]|uniref:MBL fold metallo-hydrolase n=1 Tax=Pyranulibacter aquaticus TaxID=3163344 RepID=UPI00359BECDB
MIEIKKFVFNPFQENTYLIWDTNSKCTAVVDPGCSSPYEEQQIADFIKTNLLSIKFLINTHCHIDHILGNKFIKENYKCEFWAPDKDVFMLKLMEEHAKNFGMNLKESPQPDKLISEEIELNLDGTIGKFLFTPGHTPGEYCIYFPLESVCITGDVLFKEGIGRTDLWGGDYNLLINSIKTKLFTLPEDVKIYPGHGEPSTIGYEKLHNPFLI